MAEPFYKTRHVKYAAVPAASAHGDKRHLVVRELPESAPLLVLRMQDAGDNVESLHERLRPGLQDSKHAQSE